MSNNYIGILSIERHLSFGMDAVWSQEPNHDILEQYK